MSMPLYLVDAFTDRPFTGNPAAVCLGRTRLTGFQASRRGGVVGVERTGDRVHLSGPAVTVHSGVLHV
jgi:predicted PhzF superfamily epimerase YddE/YHI9